MTLGLLLLRLVVGLTLAAHGSQKLFGAFGGYGISGTGAYFENTLGFRPGRRYAALAGVTELAGGLALALGLFTPLASAAVVGVMTVAAVAGHAKAGFFVMRGGYEYTLVLAAVASALAFTGPGRVSVDGAWGWDLHGTVWGVSMTVLGLLSAAMALAARTRVEERAPTADAVVDGAREDSMDTSRREAQEPSSP